MTSERLKEAVALTRQGDKDKARQILADMIREDVHNEMAWLWYADTMPTVDAKVQALQECLFHNPGSESARLGLQRLGTQLQSVPVQAPAESESEPGPEPEQETMPELEFAPPPVPDTRPSQWMGEPLGPAQADEFPDVLAADRGAPGLRLVASFVAALVGGIVLGYVGLLVVGYRVLSIADLQAAISDPTGLIAALVGVLVGATVGLLIVRALSTRPLTDR